MMGALPAGSRRRRGASSPARPTGRVWFTARIRPVARPRLLQGRIKPASAKLFPSQKSGRLAAMYDPKIGKFTLIDLCFTTHHLQLTRDGNDTLSFTTPQT